jgi:hypothetical protein
MMVMWSTVDMSIVIGAVAIILLLAIFFTGDNK